VREPVFCTRGGSRCDTAIRPATMLNVSIINQAQEAARLGAYAPCSVDSSPSTASLARPARARGRSVPPLRHA